MTTARLILALSFLMALQACAYTEKDARGYQTAQLIARADQIEQSDPNDTDPQTLKIIASRRAYNQAVLRGDSKAMRDALNDLDRAEKLWGGQ